MHEFKPEQATREEWTRYHAFRRRRHLESRPMEPLAPDSASEAWLSRPDPGEDRRHFLLSRGDRVISSFAVGTVRPSSPEYSTGRHLLWAEVHVLRAHRREGVGSGWVAPLMELMDGHGATVASAAAEEGAGHSFLRRLGFQPRMTERESRLDLRRVDWESVARRVRDGQARSPETRLELCADRVPEPMLVEFASALTGLLNTMPWEDMDHGEIVETPDRMRHLYSCLAATGGRHHALLTREPDGSISGITDVLWLPYEQGFVRQQFTGVRPSDRGRGLGLWLKAAMLEHVRRAHPDAVFVTTENGGSNAPMLAINDALGFELQRVVTTYQATRERLAAAAADLGVCTKPSGKTSVRSSAARSRRRSPPAGPGRERRASTSPG